MVINLFYDLDGPVLNGWLLILNKREFFDENWLQESFSFICKERGSRITRKKFKHLKNNKINKDLVLKVIG